MVDPAFDNDDAYQNVALKRLTGQLRRPSALAMKREIRSVERRRDTLYRRLRNIEVPDLQTSSAEDIMNRDLVQYIKSCAASPRLARIIDLLSEGHTHRSVAGELGIAPSLVSKEIRRLRRIVCADE